MKFIRPYEPNINKSNKKHGLALIVFFILIILISIEVNKPNENTETEYEKKWNRSVLAVKEYIRSNARNPRSIEFREWSELSKEEKDGSYMIRCKWSGENGFGGYTLENQIFHLNSSGKVLYHRDY